MPLTEFQSRLLLKLARYRSFESHIAGGIALHAHHLDGRISKDLDLFHDAKESVRRCSDRDIQVLQADGYEVQRLIDGDTFIRAIVNPQQEQFKIEWVFDSAFRFFPVRQDPNFGAMLSLEDCAINKVLALAGRSKSRDLFDVIYAAEHIMPLEAMVWAACGKDEGFSPELLMEMMRRNAVIRKESLRTLSPVDPVELKRKWLALADQATRNLE